MQHVNVRIGRSMPLANETTAVCPLAAFQVPERISTLIPSTAVKSLSALTTDVLPRLRAIAAISMLTVSFPHAPQFLSVCEEPNSSRPLSALVRPPAMPRRLPARAPYPGSTVLPLSNKAAMPSCVCRPILVAYAESQTEPLRSAALPHACLRAERPVRRERSGHS